MILSYLLIRKQKLEKVVLIMLIIGIISETIKVIYYIVRNEATHGGYLPKSDLPFHLCSIQLIFIAILHYSKNYKLKTHRETSKEQASRKSHVSKMTRDMLVEALYENLRSIYKNKLGKVYISEEMKNLAVPLQETTAEIGMGILPKGTRIHIPDNKKIRAFTYWSKVNDIDLSAIGICRDGSRQIEFSWRNFYFKQGDGMYFSGDQTRGFNGGSEFLDMDINKFKSISSN
jgi:uncharacterized protein with PQ loop repeat